MKTKIVTREAIQNKTMTRNQRYRLLYVVCSVQPCDRGLKGKLYFTYAESQYEALEKTQKYLDNTNTNSLLIGCGEDLDPVPLSPKLIKKFHRVTGFDGYIPHGHCLFTPNSDKNEILEGCLNDWRDDLMFENYS